MIAEEIKSPKAKRVIKNSINYIIDGNNNGAKVGYVKTTNCLSDDPDLVSVEFELIQRKNTRSKLDKTFHMVISFPVGEVPTREQMDDIEQVLCESVGMGHHQRISASHVNTDNYHLHVLINKIDPVTFKAVNTYYNHKNMAKACAELEAKYNLEKVDRGIIANNSIKFDYHTGEDSLTYWLSKHVKTDFDKKVDDFKTWNDVHSFFGGYGLSIEKFKNGMVIKSNDVTVKASSLSRNCSLPKLEKKLGKFKDSNKKSKEQESQYAISNYSKKMYQDYLAFKDESEAKKTLELMDLKFKVSLERTELRNDNLLRRDKIKKTLLMTSPQKFKAYQEQSKTYKLKREIIKTIYAKKRKEIYSQYSINNFSDYLIHKAQSGDEQALLILRDKSKSTLRKINGLSGCGSKTRLDSFESVSVDKNGTLCYAVAGHMLFDNGKSLSSNNDSESTMKHLLEFAVAKYGHDINVNGNDDFKQKIFQVARKLDLDITLNGESVKGIDPVDKFIQLRNSDREKVTSILEHKLLTNESGSFKFNGYRNIGSHTVILLEKNNTIYVKKISRQDLRDYKSMHRGSMVKFGTERGQDTIEL